MATKYERRKSPRTAKRLCKCGCGEVIKPPMNPGPPKSYVDDAHYMRAYRARNEKSPAKGDGALPQSGAPHSQRLGSGRGTRTPGLRIMSPPS